MAALRRIVPPRYVEQTLCRHGYICRGKFIDEWRSLHAAQCLRIRRHGRAR